MSKTSKEHEQQKTRVLVMRVAGLMDFLNGFDPAGIAKSLETRMDSACINFFGSSWMHSWMQNAICR